MEESESGGAHLYEGNFEALMWVVASIKNKNIISLIR